MNRILKIGMDVHSKTFNLCAIEPSVSSKEKIIAADKVPADYQSVLQFIGQLKNKLGSQDTYIIECGYEAGCLGYSLQRALTAAQVDCTILAPTTMLTTSGKRVKTDARDALHIAKCLAYGGYSSVHIPTVKDDGVKEYIRMRDARKNSLKKVKQQINSFCMRQGHIYSGTKWTLAHLKWLRSLEFDDSLLLETLIDYLAEYERLSSTIERMDARIEEFATDPCYLPKVKELRCLLGIKTHTALALIVETGDFTRFAKGNTFAAYIGLAPGERSSGESIHRTGITKAGNIHLRRLLIEASEGICRGTVGYKSKDLRARQKGNREEVIYYADKANERLRRKYYKMIHTKRRNVVVAAVARELACFVWGIMTGNIEPRHLGVKAG